jgi:hypothetical protein
VSDRDGVQFKIGEAFPPDSRLARWMVGCLLAFNDLLLVNRWLVPRLEGEIESEGYEHLYLARLASAHLFEIATFLRKADRFEDIREFVADLGAEDRDAYGALLAIAKGEGGEFADQIERSRNNSTHYGELLPDEAAAYEALRQAIKAHAEDETVGKIRDTIPPITGFRALFADDIAVELTFPGGDEAALGEFVEGISTHIALALQFIRGAMAAYIPTVPAEVWEDWFETT